MVAAILHQLTRNLSEEEIANSPFATYFVDHTTGLYPVAASGVPFDMKYVGIKGDVIADLHEDLAAEQKARVTYDNILRLCDDPDVRDPIKFLREREIVHYQRFADGILTVSNFSRQGYGFSHAKFFVHHDKKRRFQKKKKQNAQNQTQKALTKQPFCGIMYGDNYYTNIVSIFKEQVSPDKGDRAMSENNVTPPQNNKSSAPSERGDRLHRILTAVGIVMCVILIPILIINCTLIVKSLINKDEVPSFGGSLPLIVLTDSMYPEIKSGDLIICKTVDTADIEVGDVISFYDPAGNGTSVVTHEVVEILEDDGKISFRTKGINNNTEDRLPVPAEKVIAEYADIRIPGAGNIAIFMQRTEGLILCVILPIVLFVGYDILRRRRYEKDKGEDLEALKAELEALRAANAAKQTPPSDTPEE